MNISNVMIKMVQNGSPPDICFKGNDDLKSFIQQNSMVEWKPNYGVDYDFTYYFKNELIETFMPYGGRETISCGKFRYLMRVMYNTEHIGNKFLIMTRGTFLIFTLKYISYEDKINKLHTLMNVLFNLDNTEYHYKHNAKKTEFVVYRAGQTKNI